MFGMLPSRCNPAPRKERERGKRNMAAATTAATSKQQGVTLTLDPKRAGGARRLSRRNQQDGRSGGVGRFEVGDRRGHQSDAGTGGTGEGAEGGGDQGGGAIAAG